MGEDGGPVDVAMAVDGVDAVEHGDPEARRQGAALHAVHHLPPTPPAGRSSPARCLHRSARSLNACLASSNNVRIFKLIYSIFSKL